MKGGDNLNNTLKAYRKLLSISQTEMAEILGMCLTSYNQKEVGKKEFTHSEMITIVEFLKTKVPGITAEEIFFTNKVIKMKTESF